MAEKDLTEKILEDYNDVFADIVNGIIFKGEQRIKEKALTNVQVHSQYKADDTKLHEMERDVIKYWREAGVKITICGIENQTEPDSEMPLRIAGYEGASYRQQLLQKNGDPYVPVITLVLYFGTKNRWNKPRSLKELIHISEGLEEYVNDCKIHVCEVAWLTEEEINRFHSDFRIIANFFVNKRKNKNYRPDDPQEIKHVDELLKLLSVMSGDKRYEEILVNNNVKGVKNMCEVYDRVEQCGVEKGIRIGEERGEKQGEEKLGKLILALQADNQSSEIEHVIKDENYRAKMYEKYGI